jgi:hypothetical protein
VRIDSTSPAYFKCPKTLLKLGILPDGKTNISSSYDTSTMQIRILAAKFQQFRRDVSASDV